MTRPNSQSMTEWPGLDRSTLNYKTQMLSTGLRRSRRTRDSRQLLLQASPDLQGTPGASTHEVFCLRCPHPMCVLWHFTDPALTMSEPSSFPVIDPDVPLISSEAILLKPFSVIAPRDMILGQHNGAYEAWRVPWIVFSGMQMAIRMKDYPVPIDVNEGTVMDDVPHLALAIQMQSESRDEICPLVSSAEFHAPWLGFDGDSIVGPAIVVMASGLATQTGFYNTPG
jgi:hypothetical protein